MKQLEIKIYTGAEIAPLLDLDVNDQKHFKRNVENKLQTWGYEYIYHSKKNIEITAIPTTPAAKMREILIREYGFDTQVDSRSLGLCLALILLDEEGFAAMPWTTRVELMKAKFSNVCENESTYRKWFSRLFKTGTITKDAQDRTDFITFYADGKKYQESVITEDDEKAVERFKEERKQLLKKYGRWTPELGKELWSSQGLWVTSCKKIIFSAWDDTSKATMEELLAVSYELLGEEGSLEVLNQEPETEEEEEIEKEDYAAQPAKEEEFEKWFQARFIEGENLYENKLQTDGRAKNRASFNQNHQERKRSFAGQS